MRKFLGLPLVDWAWILFLAFWRLCISLRHGLGVDEAHYVIYGLKVDWSYFDHPPLTGWIQAFFLNLFGKHEWVPRLPAIVSGILSSVLVFRLSEKISNDRGIARFATLALNGSFLTSALWIMFVPDTGLLVLTLWLVFIIFKILERSCFRDWLELGVCLGLCGLTKYTAIFSVFSLLGIVITEKAYKKIRPWGLIVACFVALILVSPVFYWNVKHHWISFSYQQNHVMGGKALDFKKVLIFFATQIVAYSPFLIFSSLWGFWVSRKNWPLYVRIALWIALPNLVFFAYTSLKDEVLPHWTLTAWALIIPIGITLAMNKRRKVKWAVFVSLAITFFALGELTFQFIKFPPYQSPYADLTGWPELHDEVKKILEKETPGTFAIAVPNWTLGSRAHYYLEDLASVFVVDDRFDQFDLWEENQPKSKNLLVVAWRGFGLREDNEKRCGSHEPVQTKVFNVNGAPVNSVQLFWCRNYNW